MSYHIRQIGTIRTGYEQSDGMPIQSSFSQSSGKVIIFKEYLDGLDSLSSFSHIILLYWFHKARGGKLKATPYLDTKSHGIFATRAPARPNPIGISIVRLENIKENVIHFIGADMLDKTPLIDIKPFVPEFDNRLEASSGWLSDLLQSSSFSADNRFEE